MKKNYNQMSELLKAIAHPVRLKIIKGILKDECNVSAIQKKLGLPQSTISQHLKVLKKERVLKARKEGVKVCYRVTNNKIRDIIKIIGK